MKTHTKTNEKQRNSFYQGEVNMPISKYFTINFVKQPHLGNAIPPRISEHMVFTIMTVVALLLYQGGVNMKNHAISRKRATVDFETTPC